ncbi:MAG TPA: 4Fe-4S binding protein [Clostridia bacterium]|nr:4Fe-4S binding protein [Clostridia bacterium]
MSDVCICCGACISECPVNCISYKDGDVYVINNDECIQCGSCAMICPVDAPVLI